MNTRQTRLPEGWEVKKIGDLCNLMTGGTPSKSKQEYFHGGTINWLVSGDIHKREIFECEGRITELGMANSNAKLLPVNSVMIALNGQGKTRGTVALLRTNATCNQSLVSIYPKDIRKVLPEFIFCYLHGRYEEIRKITGDDGNDRRGLNMPLIRNFEIPLPPLPEQQHIVSILDECFAAIDKVKANAEQNLKNARELFESYLNSIEADKVDLGTLIDIKTGKLNSNAAVKNGKYPFFTCAKEVYTIDNYSFDLEAILLAGNNASGDFNVKHYKGKFNAYQRTYVITVNEKQKILYRYLYFQLLKSLKEFKEMSVGANTRFLKLGMIQSIKIALPSIKQQQTIVRQLDSLRAETQKLEAVYQKKIEDLDELKKSILQKAFAGELKTGKAVAV